MSIVSNASPLINLSRIGQLNLLAQLYGEVRTFTGACCEMRER